MSGCAIDVNCVISPLFSIPISKMATSISSSKSKIVNGRPISLLRFPCVFCVFFSCEKILYNISLQLVFPLEPVTPITNGRNSTKYAFARSCIALSVSSTKITGKSGYGTWSFCHKLIKAPSSIVCLANVCPSTLWPIIGTYKTSFVTCRESITTPCIFLVSSISPCTFACIIFTISWMVFTIISKPPLSLHYSIKLVLYIYNSWKIQIFPFLTLASSINFIEWDKKIKKVGQKYYFYVKSHIFPRFSHFIWHNLWYTSIQARSLKTLPVWNQ